MKKIFMIFSILILTASDTFSQIGWTWQYPQPQGNMLADVSFINENTGFSAGNTGTIIKTTNGGITWIMLERVVHDDLRSIEFINENTGFAVGRNGVFLKTVNSGNNWLLINMGTTNDIEAISFAGNNTIYIGGYNGFIRKSTDNGNNWNSVPFPSQKDIYGIDFFNSEIGMAVGGRYSQGGLIWKTTDGGLSWLRDSLTNEINPVYGVQIISPQVAFVRAFSIPYRTINWGASWGRMNGAEANVLFKDENTGWSYGNTIKKTTNAGALWTTVHNIGYNNNLYAAVLIGSQTIYSVGYKGLIYKSEDGGNRWSQLSSTLNNKTFNSVYFINEQTGVTVGYNSVIMRTSNAGVSWNIVYERSNGLGINDVVFTDANTGIACGVSSTGIDGSYFVTTNSGLNWVENILSIPQPSSSGFSDIMFVDNQIGYLLARFNLYKTTNGGFNYSLVNTEINAEQIHFTDNNTGYAASMVGEIYKTINGGTSFNTIFTSDYHLNKVCFVNADTGFITGLKFGVSNILLKTTNAGLDWQENILEEAELLGPIQFINENTGYLLGSLSAPTITYEILYYTTNKGTKWHINRTVTGNGLHGMFFTSSGTGYLTGTNSTILKVEIPELEQEYSVTGTVRYEDNNQLVTSGYVKAFKHSTLGGEIIVLDSVPIQSNGTYTVVVPNDTIDLMAFDDDADEGDSFVPTYYPSTIEWQNAEQLYPTSNMTNIDIGVFRINETAVAFRNISGGVFLNSLDAGLSGVNDAIIYAKIGNTFRGYSISNSSGAYSVDSLLPGSYQLICNRMGYPTRTRNEVLGSVNLTGIDFIYGGGLTGINQETGLPDRFSLSQNHPNPFNPVTVFKFGLPKNTFTKLVVYDLLGREVASLVNSQLIAGNYSIQWDASSFPSGVYFYRLTAGDFTDTKKMVLIK